MKSPGAPDQGQSNDQLENKPTVAALQNTVRQAEQRPLQDANERVQDALNASDAFVLNEPVGVYNPRTNISNSGGNSFFSSYQPLPNPSTTNTSTRASTQNLSRRNGARVDRSNNLAAGIHMSSFRHRESSSYCQNHTARHNGVQSSLSGHYCNITNNIGINNSPNHNVGNSRENNVRADPERNHNFDVNFLTDYSYWCPHRSRHFPLWEVLRYQYWIDIDYRNVLRQLRLNDEDNDQTTNCLLDPTFYCRYQDRHVCLWQLLRNQYIADMIAKRLGYRQTVARLSKMNHYCPIQRQEIPVCLLVKNQANADIKANLKNYSQVPQQCREHLQKLNCLHHPILFCPRKTKFVTLFELLLNEHNAFGRQIIYVVNEGGYSGYTWEIPDDLQQRRRRSVEEAADPSIIDPIQPLELRRWTAAYESVFAGPSNRVITGQFHASVNGFAAYLSLLPEGEELEEQRNEKQEFNEDVPEEIHLYHLLTDGTRNMSPLNERINDTTD